MSWTQVLDYLLKKILKPLFLFNNSPLLMKLSTNPIEDHLGYGSIVVVHTFLFYSSDKPILQRRLHTAQILCSTTTCHWVFTQTVPFQEVAYPIATCWNPTSFLQAYPKFGYYLLYFSLFSETFSHIGFISPTELVDHRDL